MSERDRSSNPLAVLVTLTLVTMTASTRTAHATPRPSVLFIAVGDLRPPLGHYSEKVVRMPSIDRLARRGSIFLRTCRQAPQLATSRLS